MLKDQKDLLSAFNEFGVEYLVVGGQAVNAHGVPRATKDLDVFVRSSEENSNAIYRALAEYGAPIKDYAPMDFRDHPGEIIQFGLPPNRIDLLQSIGTLSFEDAWKHRVRLEVDDSVSAEFISCDDLILNKIETGRLQDLADAEQLQKLKDEQ
jgi:hypothetical protein